MSRSRGDSHERCECGGVLRISDTRRTEMYRRRRKKCHECGRRFSTYEFDEPLAKQLLAVSEKYSRLRQAICLILDDDARETLKRAADAGGGE